MANFSLTNSTNAGSGVQQPIAATYKSLLGIFAGATAHRGKIFDLLVGTNGTPADNVMSFDLTRTTGTSSGYTTIVANPLDPADAVSLCLATANATTEATISASAVQWYIGINQRASYRWVAAPGSEFVWPATTSNGFVLRALSPAYTGTATGATLFSEQ